MTSLIIIGLVLLNLLISWWNCRVTGAIWHESKFVGGYMRLLAWCGAIQAAIGFSSVLILVLVFGAYATGNLPKAYADSAFSLWYLLVIFPALGTGLIITVQSLVSAWRERSIASIGGAAWNVFASAHNIYSATSAVPDAFGKVGELFCGDKDDQKVALVLGLVVLAIGGGIVATATLINHYAKQNRPRTVIA